MHLSQHPPLTPDVHLSQHPPLAPEMLHLSLHLNPDLPRHLRIQSCEQ
jgi:hypothetical protein